MLTIIRCCRRANDYRGHQLNSLDSNLTFLRAKSTKISNDEPKQSEQQPQQQSLKSELSEKSPIHNKKRKFVIDKSKVPVLLEKDLEEKFVSGSGPGGQKVNKAVNAVFLRHVPTDISVKVHQTRLLSSNRKIARELVIEKLDALYNGENSVANQLKRRDEQRREKKELERLRLLALKEEFKKKFL